MSINSDRSVITSGNRYVSAAFGCDSFRWSLESKVRQCRRDRNCKNGCTWRDWPRTPWRRSIRVYGARSGPSCCYVTAFVLSCCATWCSTCAGDARCSFAGGLSPWYWLHSHQPKPSQPAKASRALSQKQGCRKRFKKRKRKRSSFFKKTVQRSPSWWEGSWTKPCRTINSFHVFPNLGVPQPRIQARMCFMSMQDFERHFQSFQTSREGRTRVELWRQSYDYYYAYYYELPYLCCQEDPGWIW